MVCICVVSIYSHPEMKVEILPRVLFPINESCMRSLIAAEDGRSKDVHSTPGCNV